MDVSVIIDNSLPLYFTLLICGTIFGSLLFLDGRKLRAIAIFAALFYLSILFTDLRTDIQLVRENFNFDGVIYPQIEGTIPTMPVFFVEVCNTGVITGGYENEVDSKDLLESGDESFLSHRKI
jgi:hypothetical protein